MTSTVSFFLLENSFHTLPPIRFHLLVMDTENSLWREKQTASWGKKKKKKRHVIRYTVSETTEKHAFSPPSSVSNSLKTDNQVSTSLPKTSLWVPNKHRTHPALGDPESRLLLLRSWAPERQGPQPPPLGPPPWSP